MNPTPSFLEGFKQKLKIRNAPKTQKDFFMNIKEDIIPSSSFPPAPGLIREKQPEPETEQEEDQPEQPKQHKVQIIDKSATAVIDRDLIIKRIKESKANRIKQIHDINLEKDIHQEHGEQPKEPTAEPTKEEVTKPERIKIKISKKQALDDI